MPNASSRAHLGLVERDRAEDDEPAVLQPHHRHPPRQRHQRHLDLADDGDDVVGRPGAADRAAARSIFEVRGMRELLSVPIRQRAHARTDAHGVVWKDLLEAALIVVAKLATMR